MWSSSQFGGANSEKDLPTSCAPACPYLAQPLPKGETPCFGRFCRGLLGFADHLHASLDFRMPRLAADYCIREFGDRVRPPTFRRAGEDYFYVSGK